MGLAEAAAAAVCAFAGRGAPWQLAGQLPVPIANHKAQSGARETGAVISYGSWSYLLARLSMHVRGGRFEASGFCVSGLGPGLGLGLGLGLRCFS